MKKALLILALVGLSACGGAPQADVCGDREYAGVSSGCYETIFHGLDGKQFVFPGKIVKQGTTTPLGKCAELESTAIYEYQDQAVFDCEFEMQNGGLIRETRDGVDVQ